MIWLGIAIFIGAVCYFVVVAADTPENRAQNDLEQMEFLRRYNEKKKNRQR